MNQFVKLLEGEGVGRVSHSHTAVTSSGAKTGGRQYHWEFGNTSGGLHPAAFLDGERVPGEY